MDHLVAPGGGETATVAALVGPVVDMEPVCPLCGHVGAERVIGAAGDERAIPCYLSWCAAHGVHAPIRPGPFLPWPWTEERPRSIRCSGCAYWSHPSAFCRPTGPPVAS